MFNAVHTWGLLLDEKAYMNLIGFYGKAGIHVTSYVSCVLCFWT